MFSQDMEIGTKLFSVIITFCLKLLAISFYCMPFLCVHDLSGSPEFVERRFVC